SGYLLISIPATRGSGQGEQHMTQAGAATTVRGAVAMITLARAGEEEGTAKTTAVQEAMVAAIRVEGREAVAGAEGAGLNDLRGCRGRCALGTYASTIFGIL
ncbi:unnamed protein product, partial [Ectocarpus sp. 6 AP-2014]